MSIDDQYKKYSVKVNSGSGCLVQPSTNEYSYVITVKHNVKSNIENNELPKIFTSDDNKIEVIKIFTHPTYDLAIIKVEYQKDINLHIKRNIKNYSILYLFGFPDNKIQDEVKTKKVIGKLIEKNDPFFVLSSNSFDGQDDVVGFSGCGVYQEVNEIIYLSGIEFRMDSYNDDEGRINIYPIGFIEDIIENNIDQLKRIYPIYMSNFSFLEDDAFKLEVDALDEERIIATRTTLKNKALNIIESDVTPQGIKELFKERILLNHEYSEHIYIKNVWIAWLEFLTIMNIIKGYVINNDLLSEIFDTIRLKYSDEDDWTNLLRTDLLNSDYRGLKPDSTVIVSTKKPPLGNFILPKDRIPRDLRVVSKRGLQIDNGVRNPYEDFNFVHLEFFKKECIIKRLESYENIHDEDELLQILKQQYDELFS
ncbi:ABC-three component system protein [Kordia sp.]|uniref:ABC-three component system protein n=1 Tax=Kordia sp. TaxID=1965332 RepID=UPI003D2D515F